ncbi:hypothetical protein DOY81_012775 [Sarcophaga bullata]|nr:hypothetical protein DOY81_012775 [Sarcophaga bullata]
MTRCVNTQAQRLSSLKFVLMSGSTCYESNLQEIRNALPNATVINIYGTSECGGIAANFGQYKSKSVGQLFSNVELKIVNEATGEKLGPCEIGVLCVKNVYHSTTVPYYGDVGAFYKILDMEDFIITGDLGFMDDEHYLHLSERREIVLKYRNFYYSPHEYEVMIAELDDVMDVCVVGIPNEKQDDVPAAVVVKREGSLLTDCDIVKHVKMHRESQQDFLDYGVFFVKEIPRHHNGKIFIREVVELCRSMRQNKI